MDLTFSVITSAFIGFYTYKILSKFSSLKLYKIISFSSFVKNVLFLLDLQTATGKTEK